MRRRKLGGLVFELKSVGEKQEFRVMMVRHWLSYWGSQFLVGDAVSCFLLGSVDHDSFLVENSSFGALTLLLLWKIIRPARDHVHSEK